MRAIAKHVMAAVVVGAVSLAAGSARADDITGAGSTFAYPILSKWASDYKAKTGIGLNYQSIGSGGGIKQINAKTVDFGASDKPLDAEVLAAAGQIQWPTIMGGIVPVVNIPGIAAGQMRLTGKVLADIYLGNITNWNDPAIKALNPGLALPDMAIAPVYRSDGSGTTFNYTYYLADVSPEWKDKVGVNTSVQFPVGLGGKGNEGVSAFTSRTVGAIGYVEYAYALQNHLPYTLMQNKDGNFVAPSTASFQAAAANADWAHAPAFKLILANQPGKDSWPMTASTFIIFYKKQGDAQKAKQVLDFFDWSYKSGQQDALSLDYVPMPDSVVALVESQLKQQVTDSDGKPVW